MSASIRISVIIATRNRPELLEKCMESLFEAATRPQAGVVVDLVVCVNGADDRSRHVLKAAIQKWPQDRIRELSLHVPVLPAAARNRAMIHAKGEWLYFIDDDAFVDPRHFETFASVVGSNPLVAVIGGPNLTPCGSSLFQRASGAVLASRFATYRSYLRYAARIKSARPCGEEALILCNLFIRLGAMKGLRFPESFVCNEENWLLQELHEKGCKMLHEPRLHVWHERRPALASFARQVHRYGIGRGQNLRRRPSSFRLEHLVPALCVSFTCAVLVSAPRHPGLATVWLALGICYLVFWTGAATRLRAIGSEPLAVCLVGALLFPLIHVSYGFGVLRGLVTSNDRI